MRRATSEASTATTIRPEAAASSALPDGPQASAAAGRGSQHVAGAAAGLGMTEVPRRALTDAAIEHIVRMEITERQHAAVQYTEAGHTERAARLQSEAAALLAVLDPCG